LTVNGKQSSDSNGDSITNGDSMLLSMDAFVGKMVPEGWETVKYNPVKLGHKVWDSTIRGYRDVYAGEVGMDLGRFLSVVRASR
jgi:hypothetical protein